VEVEFLELSAVFVCFERYVIAHCVLVLYNYDQKY